MNKEEIVEKILAYHLESAWDMEDILETLEDHGLLTEKWKEIRHIIWEKTWKWKSNKNTYEDRIKLAWESFSEHTKKSLLKEYSGWLINPRASQFIKEHILDK